MTVMCFMIVNLSKQSIDPVLELHSICHGVSKNIEIWKFVLCHF